MLSKIRSGQFIDRDPVLFSHVLESLRVGDKWKFPADENLTAKLKTEFEHYGITNHSHEKINYSPQIVLPEMYSIQRDKILKFNETTLTWDVACSTPREFRPKYCGAISYNRLIYLVQNSFECYCPTTNTWTALPNAPDKWAGFCCTVLYEGHIYGLSWCDKFGRYDLKEKKWEMRADMPIPTDIDWYYAAATNGLIYVLLVEPSKDQDYLLQYDIKQNTWKTIHSAEQPPGGVRTSLFVLKDTLYALHKGFIQYLHPTTQKWTNLDLDNVQEEAMVMVHNDKAWFFSTPKKEGKGLLEVYDPEVNTVRRVAWCENRKHSAVVAL